MKELIVMRHAQAGWAGSVNDYERKLDKTGKRDAPMMGKYLQELHKLPELALISSSARTRQTMKLMAQSTGGFPKVEAYEELYLGSMTDYLHLIRKQPDSLARIMILGHNPTIEKLFEWLVANAQAKSLTDFVPAEMALISFATDSWKGLNPQAGELVWKRSPNALEK